MNKKKPSILYIHHYGKFGGASKSLFETVSCFKDNISGSIISQKGLVPERFRKLGFQTISTTGISVIDHTIFGYYQGVRWLVLIRELYYLPFTIMAIYKARRLKPDLVHVNEVSLLPAIILAKLILKKPLVVHARVVLHPHGFRYQLFKKVLKKYSDHVITIDKSVFNAIPKVVPTTIIHNGLQIPKESKIEAKRDTVLIVGMVGGLIHMKGILELIEAANILKRKNYQLKFILVGESPTNFNTVTGKFSKLFKLTKDIKHEVNSLISNYGLQNIIEIRPFTMDVSQVYNELDVLCFANHANAAGRPVFEAAFHHKPSICSEHIDTKDGIIHQTTGLCVKSKNPIQLAEAIEYFYLNRDEVERMGENAYLHASNNFDVTKNAVKVMEIYNHLLAGQNNL